MKTGLGEPDLRHRIRNIDASRRLVIDKNLNYAPRSLLHIGRPLKHNISLPLRAASHANVRMSWLTRGNSMAREPCLARASGRFRSDERIADRGAQPWAHLGRDARP
jgi:hypothetical protein